MLKTRMHQRFSKVLHIIFTLLTTPDHSTSTRHLSPSRPCAALRCTVLVKPRSHGSAARIALGAGHSCYYVTEILIVTVLTRYLEQTGSKQILGLQCHPVDYLGKDEKNITELCTEARFLINMFLPM